MNIKSVDKNRILRINDISFTIPRQIEDVRKQLRSNFERAKLIILRMDEYMVSSKDHNTVKRLDYQETSYDLHALVRAVNTFQRFAFLEVLCADEMLPTGDRNVIQRDNSSIDEICHQTDKIDSMKKFHEDLVEFDQMLAKYRTDMIRRPINKPSDMIYLKFCLMIEIQRDEYESCLRILLHDIIFKFHLSDFRLRCEIHVRKPIEHELVLEKLIHDSHLKTNYSAELVLWSGDWIPQQEVELYVVMKIDSTSINKYISSRFLDMAHLHVKNVLHGASKIFLRDLTPVRRAHKMVSFALSPLVCALYQQEMST